MTKLIEFRGVKDRFARSINLERDVHSEALEGYLPVGRALESVDRLASTLMGRSESALSITGPYGTGKSSLALLLDACFAPSTSREFQTAKSLLLDSAPDVFDRVREARNACGAAESGFVRAVVTARREPVSITLLRALKVGVSTFFEGQHSKASTNLLGDLSSELRRAESGQLADVATIRKHVQRLSALAPVLILIDEFGKNLEAFAESPSDGDLFLLQELAEWTKRTDQHRVALVTMQHMAFSDYADATSGAQRREWVKIQGRFEDVPFVDTPEQSRSLIAATFTPARKSLRSRLESWAAAQMKSLKRVGLSDLAAEPEQLISYWPLHPLAVAVLPELCHRYGQNERTMFSFIASSEPRSVHSYLAATDLPDSPEELPALGLDRVYDYFVDSAATMVGVSADASRWIEIDTRVRDTRGLTDDETRILKTVGLLNLVSTGGSLRASKSMLRYALQGDIPHLDKALTSLVKAGIVTFRDFADEYRVWQGSDVDLRAALETARRRLRDEPPDQVMRRALPLAPIVAARHSHEHGTLRTFDQTWADVALDGVSGLTADDRADGLLVYVIGQDKIEPPRPQSAAGKPTVWVASRDDESLLASARELLAVDEVLRTDEAVKEDWVARRELSERRVTASQDVRREFISAFSAGNCTYWWWDRAHRGKAVLRSRQAPSASVVISDVCDSAYDKALPLWNELINRHELTSQAAKARREVAEAMFSGQRLDTLGLTGGGPDVTLYRSLFEYFKIHGRRGDTYEFMAPSRPPAKDVWKALVDGLKEAIETRVNVADVYKQLSLPPYGLRQGPAPLLLLAALLAHSEELALYEHGTFRPRLGADVCERLLRNPGNFEIKCFAASYGARANYLQHLAAALNLPSMTNRHPSVVGVVGRMVADINMLPEYAKRTTSLSPETLAFRRAFLTATEPDRLLFRDLPVAMGFKAVAPDASGRWDQHQELAARIAAALLELRASYPSMLDELKVLVSRHLKADQTDLRRSLAGRAVELRDRVIDQRLRAMVGALQAELDDDTSWLENVAMQVTGVPPRAWSDEDRRRFELQLVDLGATFRRVEALHADVRATDGTFDAIRVAINSTSGADAVRLFELDNSRRESVDGVLDKVISELQREASPGDDVAVWLLARLLERELGEPSDAVGGSGYVKDQEVAS